MRTLLITLFLTSLFASRANDTLFKHLSFGKGKSVIYGGAGRIARYKELRFNRNETDFTGGTPFFVLGLDHCIHPKASNAYLGVGPYISFWSKANKTNSSDYTRLDNRTNFLLTALKLSHHYSYFVRKRFDLSTGYLVGARYKFASTSNASSFGTPGKENLALVVGISVTLRYYVVPDLGVYMEAGIGHNISLPNIGLCYQVGKKK